MPCYSCVAGSSDERIPTARPATPASARRHRNYDHTSSHGPPTQSGPSVDRKTPLLELRRACRAEQADDAGARGSRDSDSRESGAGASPRLVVSLGTRARVRRRSGQRQRRRGSAATPTVDGRMDSLGAHALERQRPPGQTRADWLRPPTRGDDHRHGKRVRQREGYEPRLPLKRRESENRRAAQAGHDGRRRGSALGRAAQGPRRERKGDKDVRDGSS